MYVQFTNKIQLVPSNSNNFNLTVYLDIPLIYMVKQTRCGHEHNSDFNHIKNNSRHSMDLHLNVYVWPFHSWSSTSGSKCHHWAKVQDKAATSVCNLSDIRQSQTLMEYLPYHATVCWSWYVRHDAEMIM